MKTKNEKIRKIGNNKRKRKKNEKKNWKRKILKN